MMKLLKFIKDFWREILLTVTLSVFVTLLYYWTVDRPEGMFAQSFMIIGIVADGVCAVLILRSLWRAKWRKIATAGMQRIFARIQRFFERFADKLGIRRTNKKVLSGKTTVVFDKFTGNDEKNASKASRPPKWKQLDSERERMRYLYRQMISEKLKKGALIYSSDTPSEAEKKVTQGREQDSSESELFDIYIDMRYDERKYPDSETVKRLKKELDIK